MENSNEGPAHIAADLIDIPSDKRPVQIEILCPDEEKIMAILEGRNPKIKGIGFHCHSSVPVIDEEGAQEQLRCDYIVFDLQQVVELKAFLEKVSITKKDGTPFDE